MVKKEVKKKVIPDKRKRRDYVGENIEEKQPNTQKNIKETADLETKIPPAAKEKTPEEEPIAIPGAKKKRKGLFEDLFKKKEKMIKLFECPGCEVDSPEEMIAFLTAAELGQHLYDVHGLKLIDEDIQACMTEVNKDLADKIIKGMAEANEQLKQEEIKQAKRFETALETPPEEEPEELINPKIPKNPGEVYSRAIERITTSNLQDPGKTEDQEIFSENLVSGGIEVTIIKRFPMTKEVLDALQTLKLAQI